MRHILILRYYHRQHYSHRCQGHILRTIQSNRKYRKICNKINPDTQIQYSASGIQLSIHSDVSYISVSKSQSRSSRVHFFSERPTNSKLVSTFLPTINGIIYVVCKIIRNIMASAAETEYGIININAQQAIHIRTTLIEIRWP